MIRTKLRKLFYTAFSAAAGYFGDVTESEYPNRITHETNQRLLYLLDLCPMPIVELDKGGYIVRLNSAMVELNKDYLPYTKEQLIGKNVRGLASELGYEFDQSVLAQVLEGREVRNEHVVRFGRHWIANGLPMYEPETGALSGAMAIYHDISQYEQFKNEMARLEYLNAVGETASTFAHELRNPATTIRGFVQMLSLRSKDEYHETFQIILEELDRMNGIIEDFLSLSRSRSIPKMPNDLNKILSSLYPLLSADTFKNDIELKYELSENIPILELNPKEMRQLVLNLARNGIEAMEPKGTLTIGTRNVTSGVELLIRDTGSGIPPAVLQSIFEPFYTTKNNGTGLGLPVSRNIVVGHGGTIQVKTEVGKGTTFTIYLPI